MRTGLLTLAAFAVVSIEVAVGKEPERSPVNLLSETLMIGLPLHECEKAVHQFRLEGYVDSKGEGKGTLEFDSNPPHYDELGLQSTDATVPPLKLECTLKLVKKKKVETPESGRPGAPLVEVVWEIYEIQGPRITSKLSLVRQGEGWGWGRLLVHDKDGKVRYVAGMSHPRIPEPCHPGCFPAGTPIRTPDGTRPVETIRAGDVVTSISPDGVEVTRKVQSVFKTWNRLIEVRTDDGTLVTTPTQPLALVSGELRASGELKVGDQIWRWEGHARKAVTVRSVISTGREEAVFNLVLGDSVVFIADGFVVRSKPPLRDAKSTTGADPRR